MTLELRIELLRLTKPNFDMPDIEAWIARAKQLEAYVTADVHDDDVAIGPASVISAAFIDQYAQNVAAITEQKGAELRKVKRVAPKL